MKAISISLVALLLVARTAWAIPITSTLDIHYDGTNVSTAGPTNVSSWNNQGLLGAAGNATPSTANVPTLVTGVLNGQNVIDFPLTPAPTVLQSPPFATPMAQANHVFFVLNRDTAAGDMTVFDGVVEGGRHFVHLTPGGIHMYAGSSVIAGSGLTTGTYRIFSAIFNTTSSQIDVNAAAFLAGNVGTQPLGRLALGASPPNSNAFQFDGQYAEVAVYSTNLNGAEQKIVENYLSAKYNVGGTVVPTGNNTLGTNDHYEGDLASKLNFDSDVFGIGRVNVTNQLTTSENNAGLQLTGDGTLGDSEWVLAGHKTAINSINPDGSWARVWYVDKTSTGSVNATLTFDYSEAGLVAPDLTSDLIVTRLLFNPTMPSNFSTLLEGGTVVGDSVSFFVPDAQLLDGYYTLQAVLIPEPSTGMLLGLGGLGLVVRARRRRLAQL